VLWQQYQVRSARPAGRDSPCDRRRCPHRPRTSISIFHQADPWPPAIVRPPSAVMISLGATTSDGYSPNNAHDADGASELARGYPDTAKETKPL
jgi:hypothetical protein